MATDLAMPPEWAEHERTLMAWPTRVALWGDALGEARRVYAEIARAIAAFEPVLMVAPPGSGAEARDLCGGGVEVVEIPIDDSWIRDSGPIFVTGPGGRRAGVAGKGETLDVVPRLLITGRRVAGSSFGGVKGRDQVPQLVDRYLAGDIDVDSFISHRITLDEVNRGFELMEAQDGIRSVIEYPS